jgi:hypothetical protein
MKRDPAQTYIYHITDVTHLPGILAEGGLLSDARMAHRNPGLVIGYDHIKLRRLQELRVDCCENRFVGEFVPFYFCPRSPMLYTVNIGKTGLQPGCQKTIVHLVGTVQDGINLGRDWAISSGNAGAYHTSFRGEVEALDGLDWEAISARQWQGRTHQKSAEFLLGDFFPWTGIWGIGCQNSTVAEEVRSMLKQAAHQPKVAVKPDWYY